MDRKRWMGLILLLVGYCALQVGRFHAQWRHYTAVAEAGSAPPWTTSGEEAIVVLTGARGRIPRAVDLLRSRESAVLLVTGAGKATTKLELLNQQKGSAARAPEIWERIEVESQAATTIENARESAKLLSQKSIKRVILVTSDYHMPRALAVFQRLYPDVEYWPYAVPDPSPERSSLLSQWRADYAKPTVEFLKWVVFRHGLLLFLFP